MRLTLAWHRLGRFTLALGALLGTFKTAGADSFTANEVITTPSPQAFSICYGYGCKEIARLSLQAAEWREIRRLFVPPPADSQEERSRIALAIARLESLVGDMTNTRFDKGGTFNGGLWSSERQMDCIDESTNSTTYLKILESEGLLHRHRVLSPASRGFFIFGWPHNTAVILDTSNNRKYAVDSWFHDNGIAPEIIDFTTWRSGWDPGDNNRPVTSTTPD